MLVAFGEIYKEVEKLVESQQTSRAKINEEKINELIKSTKHQKIAASPTGREKPFLHALYSE